MPRAIQFDPTASHTTSTVTTTTSYTKLWLDGSDLEDKSGTNTLTVTGVTSSTAQSKFGGSSLFFDGTDDKIIFSNTGGSLQLNGPFTVEFWARWDGGSGYNSLLAFGDPSNNYTALLVGVYAYNWRIWMANAANNGFNPSAQGFGGASANTWQHISINCNANASSVECYVDGVRGYNGQGNNNSFDSSDSYSLSGRAVGQRYGGYVDDFFVLNGYKLRTGPASFAVPTTPFDGSIEITSTSDTRSYSSVFDLRSQYKERAANNWPTLPYDSRISLYLPFDTNFADLSSYNHSPTESFNGAQYVQTSVAQFGGSAFFDNNDDYVTYPNHSSFLFGSSDFTVEGFFNASSVGADGLLGIWGSSNSGQRCWLISFSNSNLYAAFSIDGNSATSLNSGVTVSTGQWYNFSFTRQGNTFRLFVDGVLKATATNSSALRNSSQNLTIGSNNQSTTSLEYHGYLDDIRITKGLCLYTQNYTVPTVAVANTLTVNP